MRDFIALIVFLGGVWGACYFLGSDLPFHIGAPAFISCIFIGVFGAGKILKF